MKQLEILLSIAALVYITDTAWSQVLAYQWNHQEIVERRQVLHCIGLINEHNADHAETYMKACLWPGTL